MLPRIVGLGRAAELLYTGRDLPGTQAYDWGFYNELCDPPELLARARLRGPRRSPPGRPWLTPRPKGCCTRSGRMPLDDAIDAEARAQAACMESRDFRRAYEAFVAKRAPQFEGD